MDECQLEKPGVVCLCGSTRFVEVFRYVNQRGGLKMGLRKLRGPSWDEVHPLMEAWLRKDSSPGLRELTRLTASRWPGAFLQAQMAC